MLVNYNKIQIEYYIFIFISYLTNKIVPILPLLRFYGTVRAFGIL